MSRLITRIPLGHIPKKRTHWCLNWHHILNGLEFTTPSPRSGFTLLFGNIVIVFFFFVFSSPEWYICSLVLYYEGFCDLFYFSFLQIYITTKKYPYFALLNFLCVTAQLSKLVYVKSVGKNVTKWPHYFNRCLCIQNYGFHVKGWKCLPLPEKSVPRGKVSVKPTRLYNE